MYHRTTTINSILSIVSIESTSARQAASHLRLLAPMPQRFLPSSSDQSIDRFESVESEGRTTAEPQRRNVSINTIYRILDFASYN